MQICRNYCYYCTMYEDLSSELKKHGYSLTKPRQAVFSALHTGLPKSMNELIMDLSGAIDRASIYRTVKIFEELGIISRVNHGWKYKVELSDKFAPHHHHLTCTNCGKSVSFDEPQGLIEILDKIAANNGFINDSHSLEISGLCPNCQIQAKNQ